MQVYKLQRRRRWAACCVYVQAGDIKSSINVHQVHTYIKQLKLPRDSQPWLVRVILFCESIRPCIFLCGEFLPYDLGTHLSKVFSEFFKKKCRQISRKKLWNHQKNSMILLLNDQIELNLFVADHHFVWYGEQPTNMCWLLVAGMIWLKKNAHFEESEETWNL